MSDINLQDLSKGSLSRIKYLVKQYGSIEAVIEASIELLIKVDTNPLLTAGARDKLNVLADKYQGDESAVVEIALINLLKLVNQDRKVTGIPSYQQLNYKRDPKNRNIKNMGPKRPNKGRGEEINKYL